jgi:hypothetical protein
LWEVDHAGEALDGGGAAGVDERGVHGRGDHGSPGGGRGGGIAGAGIAAGGELADDRGRGTGGERGVGEFSTLIAAVVSADLVKALSAVGQRTVFAPTDAAFGALGLDASNVGDLPKDVLESILLYHVAPGRRYAADVVSSDRIRMSNGGVTTIRVENGAAYINDSQIVVTDVEASNGVIHVIDAVLLS